MKQRTRPWAFAFQNKSKTCWLARGSTKRQVCMKIQPWCGAPLTCTGVGHPRPPNSLWRYHSSINPLKPRIKSGFLKELQDIPFFFLVLSYFYMTSFPKEIIGNKNDVVWSVHTELQIFEISFRIAGAKWWVIPPKAEASLIKHGTVRPWYL